MKNAGGAIIYVGKEKLLNHRVRSYFDGREKAGHRAASLMLPLKTPCRPCLAWHIGRWSAPCAERISVADYNAQVKNAVRLLEGKREDLARQWESEMKAASAALDFELAAKLRDRVQAVEATFARQKADATDASLSLDVVASCRAGKLATVVIVEYRGGVFFERRHFHLECNLEQETAELLTEFLPSWYLEQEWLPPEIALEVDLGEEGALLSSALSEKAGRKVALTVPQRGDEVGTVVSFEFAAGAGVVLVDGKVACANKAKCGQELATGSHVVSASRDGYRDTTFTITVPRGNNRYTLRLTPQTGVLTVRAQDSESGDAVAVDLYVDGQNVGSTPWSGPVAVAAQNIELRAEGYESAVVTERPEAGKKRTVQAQLKAVSQVPPGMVAIKAGCFDMGSTDGEADEKPVHRVCLSAFYMDQTEVTNAQFRRSQGRNPHESDGSCQVFNGSKWEQGNLAAKFQGDKQPAVCVDWTQAQAYCQSQGKRLPTEAKWEYAARAGTSTKWHWGNSESQAGSYAWYMDNSGDNTHPVGKKKPNAFGLYDMVGNVWEWTSDWNGDYSAGSQQDPSGPTSGLGRVFRGGDWGSSPAVLRSAARIGSVVPGYRRDFLGFRCVSQ